MRRGCPDRLWRASPRLTPLAIEPMVCKKRDTVEAMLAERGLARRLCEPRPKRWMEFTIDAAG